MLSVTKTAAAFATVVGASVGGVVLTPSAASATPPSGVTGTILFQQTVAGTQFVLRDITIQPGGTTGWHFHDGNLYAVVKSGTLTHEMSDCSTIDVYHRGEPIVEAKGPDLVHRAVNLGSTPVVLEVLYVLPAGAPLSEDAADPGCQPLG